MVHDNYVEWIFISRYKRWLRIMIIPHNNCNVANDNDSKHGKNGHSITIVVVNECICIYSGYLTLANDCH